MNHFNRTLIVPTNIMNMPEREIWANTAVEVGIICGGIRGAYFSRYMGKNNLRMRGRFLQHSSTCTIKF
jgi:hypothetical protein